jgi:hypothetical protein
MHIKLHKYELVNDQSHTEDKATVLLHATYTYTSEMAGACSMDGEGERNVHGFGGET